MVPDTLSRSQLTDEDASLLRARLRMDQQQLATLKQAHDILKTQIASREQVMDALEESITRALRLLGEDGPLLPSAESHRDLFGGPFAPLAGEVVPSPAREQLANGQPPDGMCAHCRQPVWRVGVSEASPTGLTHGFGATCDPNDPDSHRAELAES